MLPPHRLRRRIPLVANHDPFSTPHHMCTPVPLETFNKDSPKLVTHTCEGQAPSANDNMQICQADQLEGEELGMPAMSSELTAAPGTPSSFNTSMSPTTPPEIALLPEPAPELHNPSPPVAPVKNAHRELVLAPQHTATAAVKIWFNNPDPQPSDEVAHSGTHAPCLVLSTHPPGAFVEDPGESGGVQMVENGALPPLNNINGIKPLLQSACINTIAQHHRPPDPTPLAMLVDQQVHLFIDHTPRSTTDCAGMHDEPHCKAVHTLDWAMLAMHPDTPVFATQMAAWP